MEFGRRVTYSRYFLPVNTRPTSTNGTGGRGRGGHSGGGGGGGGERDGGNDGVADIDQTIDRYDYLIAFPHPREQAARAGGRGRRSEVRQQRGFSRW